MSDVLYGDMNYCQVRDYTFRVPCEVWQFATVAHGNWQVDVTFQKVERQLRLGNTDTILNLRRSVVLVIWKTDNTKKIGSK